MDLDELHAFLAIVEHGSLLEAARALGVSRTTLRRRAEALEERAGVPLYTTTATGVHPTEAGLALVTHGRRLVQESAAMMTAIREVGHEPTGVLRLVMPVGMPPHAAVPLHASVRARYPRLTIDVRISEDPIGGRLDDVDLALHFGPRPARGPWITKRLVPLRHWLVASRGYLTRHGTPTSLDALADHAILAWRGPEQPGASAPLAAGGSFPITPVVVSSDIHMLRQCAIAGIGIALIPDRMLPDPGFSEPPLVPVLDGVVGQDMALWAAIPEALRQAPKIRAALDSLAIFRDAVPPAG
ncbi:MAG: LysR family transcriptional regulator [Deltaproteobacteria bacterium]|nr:LysR family transcriptional regulator [Deltaproteobacteria bacterium]